MGDGTSDAERALSTARAPLAFGHIVIVGGGCYGSYYVRQLTRALAAGAVTWTKLSVVDRDPNCAVALLPASSRPKEMVVVTAEWNDFFGAYLGAAALHRADTVHDAIVPSPLMPHLMADWLTLRAHERWPDRSVEVAPLAVAPPVPWQMTGADHTHYVSFAEWICPINCIEPARCPATRSERSWSLPPTLERYVSDERSAGRELDGPLLFHCTHRAFGVGMIDVAAVLDADRAISQRAATNPGSFLVGTVSHCHGALRRIDVGPLPPEREK